VTARRDLLQESLEAIERLQARLRVAEQARHEPIAILGAGCRFPGGVEDLDKYWRVLEGGINAVSDVPADRWDADAYYDPDPKAPGKMCTRRAGFLVQVDRFDPQFFGISPREAATMDPQQRLLLEVAWEALESAALSPERLAGSSTGVFVGITTSDYGQLMRLGAPESSDVYSATGVALNAAAGRLSFVLGLQGPCVAVDTACSSSLVALHLACQSLRTGESDLALAGGVNVILSPDAMILFSKWGMMAPDGHCKTFDARADGFVRGEGCAVVALKRLSDAQAAGDPIMAVIRGSAMNQDGRSSGLTVPNGLAQQQVIRAALRSAALEPRDLDYVEAHGTGTSLGDPIEVEALGAVLGRDRTPSNPLLIGSVKTNLGHTEAASGLAGVLKVVASLQHEVLPPHLHFETPNPRIPWDQLPLAVTAQAVPWTRGERVRRAGVSSFGFSGTNAHVILEEAPGALVVDAAQEARVTSMPLAARDDAALRALATRHLEDIRRRPAVRLEDRACTVATGRAHGLARAAFVASTTGELEESLRSWLAGSPLPGTAAGSTRTGRQPRVAFFFTGQGAQYRGMGRGLYDSEPAYRAALDRCAQLLAPVLPRPLLDVLHGPVGDRWSLDDTGLTQPALFALEYALAELWRSWGITPSVVLGHSIGEFVAACIAGVMTLEEACMLVATRGRLMQGLPRGGAMASVFAPLAEVNDAVLAAGPGVTVAAYNGPAHVVISGEAAAVDRVIVHFEPRGVRCQRLAVSHAFHSPLVEPMLDAFEDAARKVSFRPPRITMISNLTGRAVAVDAPVDARYWRRHAREAVQFHASVNAVLTDGCDVVLEVGPAPVLASMASEAYPHAPVTWLASLRKGKDDRREVLAALGELFVHGAPVRWAGLSAPGARRITLPTYPFQRERYWISTPHPGSGRPDDHPLLGAGTALAQPGSSVMWESDLSLRALPWLGDHRVQGAVIVPATAYIEMALAAARRLPVPGSLEVTDFQNLKPILLDESTVWRVQVSLQDQPGGWAFAVHGREGPAGLDASAPWTLHASGAIASVQGGTAIGPDALEQVRRRCRREVSGVEFYEEMRRKGNEWGPAFRGLQQVWVGDGEAVGLVRVPGDVEGGLPSYLLHPAVSDSCGHTLVAALQSAREGGREGAFVGAGVGTVRFHQRMRGQSYWVHAAARASEPGPTHIVHGDVRVYDESGCLLTETIDARLWYLDSDARQLLVGASPGWFHAVEWDPLAGLRVGPRQAAVGPWLIVGDAGAIGHAIVEDRLQRREATHVVRFGARLSLGDEGGVIRPDHAGDWSTLMNQYPETSIVLYFSPMTGADAVASGTERALHLLQATLSAPGRPRVWICTRDAQPVLGGDALRGLGAASLWGLGRSFAAEHAHQWGGLVDLDLETAPNEAAAILQQAVASGPEDDKLAVRGGRTLVPRLRQRAPAGRDTFTVPATGTCLVTGGLGGIGLAMARWLVDRGARHLVLVGRTGLPPRSEWKDLPAGGREAARVQAILEMEHLGARVEVAALDIAEPQAITVLLGQRRSRGEPPLWGVIHAAGVLAFAPVASQDVSQLRQLVAAKTSGAWALHEATLGEPLALFVACSSASSVLPSPLLGAYAAGNAFLDCLAHHRRALGLHALSVNWGTWGEVGMAVEAGRAAHGAMLKGVGTITTTAGLAALGALLAGDAAQALVMPVNWQELAVAYPAFASDPLFSAVIDPAASPSGTRVTEGASGTRDEGKDAMTSLRRHAASVLGLAVERLDPMQPLSMYGLDSLMAVELKNRIERDWDVIIPMVQFLQGPSVSQLTNLVIEARPPEAMPDGEVWEEGSL